MVMDISIEPIDIPFDNTSRYYAYTVHADDHRILTVVTSSGQTLSKWLNDLLKSTAKNANSPILIGVSAEREFLEFTKRGIKDEPYDILTLCAGSNCLIYYLDSRETTYHSRDLTLNKALRAFFENPRVVAVGMEMQTMAKKMERYNGIRIKNAVDLRVMAMEGLKKKGEQLDLMRYDLDKLAVTVVGKHVDVVRPEEKVEWYYGDSIYFWWWERELTEEKVQFATIDAYLCFLVGSELNNMIRSAGSEDSGKSKRKNKKKN